MYTTGFTKLDEFYSLIIFRRGITIGCWSEWSEQWQQLQDLPFNLKKIRPERISVVRVGSLSVLYDSGQTADFLKNHCSVCSHQFRFCFLVLITIITIWMTTFHFLFTKTAQYMTKDCVASNLHQPLYLCQVCSINYETTTKFETLRASLTTITTISVALRASLTTIILSSLTSTKSVVAPSCSKYDVRTMLTKSFQPPSVPSEMYKCVHVYMCTCVQVYIKLYFHCISHQVYDFISPSP